MLLYLHIFFLHNGANYEYCHAIIFPRSKLPKFDVQSNRRLGFVAKSKLPFKRKLKKKISDRVSYVISYKIKVGLALVYKELYSQMTYSKKLKKYSGFKNHSNAIVKLKYNETRM